MPPANSGVSVHQVTSASSASSWFSRSSNRAMQSFTVRTHVAMGDAHTKEKKYDQARRAWRTGLAKFPDSAELKARLAISDNRALLTYV